MGASKEKQVQKQPRGELVSRVVAMPADANLNGDIFGGWVMSQMDLGASVVAMRTAGRRVVTVAVDGMSFLYPVNIGDLVSCYGQLESIGRTSMKIRIEVWVERMSLKGVPLMTTQAMFTYVAIDDNGRPVPVKPE
ncbi:MAG TPA: acyl-CoA thioesterase [Gammaproteobacteria bacterium]|nr:acyl-CoA thioesterase [Gammaproteobacteria bacterium]